MLTGALGQFAMLRRPVKPPVSKQRHAASVGARMSA
jgi:hypothetical protein